MCNAIFIFGPSCSGKSTLGQALQTHLGHEWTYLDRDDLEESTADQVLEEKIASLQSKMIVDCQVPWRKKKDGELYVMILSPLDVLLERDAKRTENLQRCEKRAYYAREFVVKTYQILSNLDPKQFDVCFDSRQLSIADEICRMTPLLR